MHIFNVSQIRVVVSQKHILNNATGQVVVEEIGRWTEIFDQFGNVLVRFWSADGWEFTKRSAPDASEQWLGKLVAWLLILSAVYILTASWITTNHKQNHHNPPKWLQLLQRTATNLRKAQLLITFALSIHNAKVNVSLTQICFLSMLLDLQIPGTLSRTFIFYFIVYEVWGEHPIWLPYWFGGVIVVLGRDDVGNGIVFAIGGVEIGRLGWKALGAVEREKHWGFGAIMAICLLAAPFLSEVMDFGVPYIQSVIERRLQAKARAEEPVSKDPGTTGDVEDQELPEKDDVVDEGWQDVDSEAEQNSKP